MRKKVLILAICIFMAVVIQSTVLDYAKIYNVKPNLLLTLIVVLALLRGSLEGGVIGFFAGLLQDMAAGRVLGFYALLGMYAGLIIGSLNRRVYRENIFVAIFFTFVVSVIYEWAVYLLTAFMTGPVDLWYPFRYIILPEAGYNSIISIFVYFIALGISRSFDEIDKGERKY